MFKCLGPAHIGLQQRLLPGASGVRALPPEERVAAVAASLESVWP